MTIISSYLPLDKFHIIDVRNLSPASIKEAAKNTYRDREKIGHTTILNAITKSLGIKGGFSGYQQEWREILEPFLNENGLLYRKDLFNFRKGGLIFLRPIKRQDLSERLFYSGNEIPEQVFTGYDYDFSNTLDDGYYYANSNISTIKYLEQFGAVNNKNNPHYEPIYSYIDLANGPNADHVIPPQAKGYNARSLIDVVLGGVLNRVGCGFNLIGDLLVYPQINTNCNQTYWVNSCDHERKEQESAFDNVCFELLRKRIAIEKNGWVDIIPYNENLIFLKGRNGEYDFLFKNQRDQLFDHQIFGSSLKRVDVPSCIVDYHYRRWSYFEYEGFRQRDRHEAEYEYYASGGTEGDYPGLEVVERKYYSGLNKYKEKSAVSSKHLDGFKLTTCLGKQMMVSDVVNIEELFIFLANNPEYAEYRVGDNLEAVNSEADRASPASVTWYDALAYIKWLEDKHGIQIRLLTLDEYFELDQFKRTAKPASTYRDHVQFLKVDETPYDYHSPYMANRDFDRLKFQFKCEIPSQLSHDGIRFYDSNDFAEWLLEKTCIRTGNHKSLSGDDFILRNHPALISTGKYKGVKTGFRLCYEYAPN